MIDIIQKLEQMIMISAIILIVLGVVTFVKQIFLSAKDNSIPRIKNNNTSEKDNKFNTKQKKIDTESSMARIDLKILDNLQTLSDSDDDDYYKMFIKYKRKCTDFQKINILHKKEISRLKKTIINSDAKKEAMKDLIRKLDLKLKQKNNNISELQNKLSCVKSSNAIVDVITKIKSMYRVIQTIFLSSMRFNDEISINNPICQDVELDDPMKILAYIEKMLFIIIKNSKYDHNYDENCSVATYTYNQKDFATDYQSVLGITDYYEPSNLNPENICTKCDDTKLRLKKLVNMIKILQKEITESQKTETFVNNIESLLSMYSEDKIENIRNVSDSKSKHDFILTLVGNCLKKWCECKQQIEKLQIIETNYKDLHKKSDEFAKENKELVLKLQILNKWKQQILSMLKEFHSEEYDTISLDPNTDDNTSLIKITNWIKNTHVSLNAQKSSESKTVNIPSEKNYVDRQNKICSEALDEVKRDLEFCKYKLEKYQKDICNKEGNVQELITFLQKYIEVKFINTNDKCKYVYDEQFIKKALLKIINFSRTVGSSVIIDIIESHSSFNQELIKNCIENQDNLTNNVLLEIIDERCRNNSKIDPKIVDELFVLYTQRVNNTMAVYLKTKSRFSDAIVPKHNHEYRKEYDYIKSVFSDNIEKDIKTCTVMKQELEMKINNILKHHLCDNDCVDDSIPNKNNESGCAGCMIKFDSCHILEDSESDIDEKIINRHMPVINEVSFITKCNCKIHKKYCEIMKTIKQCQKNNIDLLIKVNHLESDIRFLSKQMMTFNCKKTNDEEQIDINLSYLPEYMIYFDCHGYPLSVDDYLKIDIQEIEKIRKSIEENENKSYQ